MHLTEPHEWDPSVLDFTHPSGDQEPPLSNDPNERFAFNPDFDEFGDYTQRAIQSLSILDDSSLPLTPCSTIRATQHVIRSNQHVVKVTPLTMKNSGFILVGSMWILFRKSWNSPPNGESPYPIPSLSKSTSSLGIQPLTFLGDMSLLLLILSFLTHQQ